MNCEHTREDAETCDEFRETLRSLKRARESNGSQDQAQKRRRMWFQQELTTEQEDEDCMGRDAHIILRSLFMQDKQQVFCALQREIAITQARERELRRIVHDVRGINVHVCTLPLTFLLSFILPVSYVFHVWCCNSAYLRLPALRVF